MGETAKKLQALYIFLVSPEVKSTPETTIKALQEIYECEDEGLATLVSVLLEKERKLERISAVGSDLCDLQARAQRIVSNFY